jgi:UDP:flavonoid glycosyltransferase YjiC (YdhE family)
MSFTGTGHLNSLILLSQQLKERGHKITFFEKNKIESRVRQAGLDFFPIGTGRSSLKEQKAQRHNLNLRSQLSTLQFNLKRITHDLEMYLEETPSALRRTGVDALLINEIALTGPTVAQITRLPYFIISPSVPHIFGWNDFPWLSGYKYSASWLSFLETALFEVSALRMRGPIRRAIDAYRHKVGLGPVREARRSFPELAQITQLPKCLDLPRTTLPADLFYT